MALQAAKVRRLLNDIKTRDEEKRRTALLKIFSSFDSMNYILQHHAKFRAAVLDKCTKYSNINDEEYAHSTEPFKESLQSLCQKAVMQIAIKYPYKYPLRLMKPAESSPGIYKRYVMKDIWAARAEARRIRLSYNSLYK